jgi:hypothetical protein
MGLVVSFSLPSRPYRAVKLTCPVLVVPLLTIVELGVSQGLVIANSDGTTYEIHSSQTGILNNQLLENCWTLTEFMVFWIID